MNNLPPEFCFPPFPLIGSKRYRKSSIIQNNAFPQKPLKVNELTPIKYNGCQLKNETSTSERVSADSIKTGVSPISMGIDYLIVNIRIQNLPDDLFDWSSRAFRFEDIGYGTKFYKKRYNLFHKGEEVGQVIAYPRSPILPEDMIKLRINNQVFYDQGARNVVKAFCVRFMGQFCGIERLDLCVDAHDFNGFNPIEFYKNWGKGYYKKKGRQAEKNPFFKDRKDRDKMTGFSIGTRKKTERFFKCYDKTLEMSWNYKPHIYDKWKADGLNPKKPIYRCEVELSKRFFNTLYKASSLYDIQEGATCDSIQEIDNFFDLIAPHNLVKLFKLGVRNFFDFKTRQGNQVDFFDWICMDSYNHNRIADPIIKLGRKTKKESVWGQVVIAKGLFRYYYKSDQSEVYLYALKTLIDSSPFLAEYVQTKWQGWIIDIGKEVYNPLFDFDFMLHQIRDYEKAA